MTFAEGQNGYPISAEPADKDYSDISLIATLRNSVLKQPAREAERNASGHAFAVKPQDVMKRVRIRKNSSLIVFLVDLSWSMAVTKRMAATKTAVTEILSRAYEFRDDVCLITFQKDSAEIVVPPTHSVALAERYMKNMKVGGKTPLAEGLKKADEVIRKARHRYEPGNIVLILLSDCDANVSLTGNDPMEEALSAAGLIASEECRAVVINSDQMTFGQGHANTLAKRMNAACWLISDFNAGHLIKAVRDELIL